MNLSEKFLSALWLYLIFLLNLLGTSIFALFVLVAY